MTKYDEDTDKIKFPVIRKILINNTKFMYKNNNKNCLQILEALTIKNKNLIYKFYIYIYVDIYIYIYIYIYIDR